MPYDQFGYGSEPQYNLDGSIYDSDQYLRPPGSIMTQPPTMTQGAYARSRMQPPPMSPGAYNAITGNAWSDQQYGAYLSPSEKMTAEKLHENVGNPQMAKGALDALSMLDSKALQNAQRLGTDMPGTPDWIKAKVPSTLDPKGALIAPATSYPSRVGAGPSAFEPNPNYGRPRSAGIMGLYQPAESRYRFRDDTETLPELRGTPPPTPPKYAGMETMTPAQHLALAEQWSLRSESQRAGAAVPPEKRTYPTTGTQGKPEWLKNQETGKMELVPGAMTYGAGGEKIPPELKVMPTSKMTPAQIADAQAGYQRIMDDARQPEGYRVRAKNLLTRADAAFPEAVKQPEGHTTRLKALYDDKRAALNAQFFPKGGGISGLPANNTSDEIRTQMDAANKSFQKTYKMSLFTPDEIDSWAAQAGSMQGRSDRPAETQGKKTADNIYSDFLNDAYDKRGAMKTDEELAVFANAHSLRAKAAGINITPEELLAMLKVKKQPVDGAGQPDKSPNAGKIPGTIAAYKALIDSGKADRAAVLADMKSQNLDQGFIDSVMKGL